MTAPVELRCPQCGAPLAMEDVNVAADVILCRSCNCTGKFSDLVREKNDEEILEILRDKKAIILLNKSDLTPVVTKEMLEARTDMPVLAISARQEQGVELLEEQIKSMFFAGELSFNDEVYITNVRHKTALEEAYQSLTMVEKSIAMEMPEDFFSIDLMNAYEALGRIVGESVGEDLVNEIFSKFCTGK